MRLGLFAVALMVGVVLPLQAGTNAQLRAYVGSPVNAAVVSFVVGTIALVAVSVLTRQSWSGGQLTGAPWWIWVGGICGAIYVAASVVLVPRIGVGNTVIFALAGQVVASLAIDHFGIARVPVHSIGPARLVGAALVIAGAVLVQRF